MHAAAGLIGPNAITRVAEVLPPRVGPRLAQEVFERAGLLHHLHQPPQQMVAEDEVRQLHRALHQALGDARAREVAAAAGRATAAYLLAHRIPRLLQALLRRLPARLSARVLLAAISRHAWTFVGSGRFSYTLGLPVVLQIRHNPLCRGRVAEAPACDFYAATFQQLFQALVHRSAQVREVACEACGSDGCRFEIRWNAAQGS